VHTARMSTVSDVVVSASASDDDLPVETSDGDLEWRVGGLRHREDDLPAVEHADGGREWWDRGLRHRMGGPAVEAPPVEHGWWRDGRAAGDDVRLILERAYVPDLREVDAWRLLGAGDLWAAGWIAAVVAANESPFLGESVRVTAGILIVDLLASTSGEWVIEIGPTGLASWR
jgi:hypothetical protein